MYPFLLQDWVTLQSSVKTITQTEPLWLDMSNYLDFVAWLEVKQVSTSAGTLSLGYQTCPTKDDSLFLSMNDTTVALTAGVQVAVLLRDTALCPLTKWLRWQLIASTTSTWQITFRIWITASQPGGYALEDLLADNAATAAAGGPDYVQASADASPLAASSNSRASLSALTPRTFHSFIQQKQRVSPAGPAPPKKTLRTTQRRLHPLPEGESTRKKTLHDYDRFPEAFHDIFPLNTGDPEIKTGK